MLNILKNRSYKYSQAGVLRWRSGGCWIEYNDGKVVISPAEKKFILYRLIFGRYEGSNVFLGMKQSMADCPLRYSLKLDDVKEIGFKKGCNLQFYSEKIFSRMSNCVYIDARNLDVTQAGHFTGFFEHCPNLKIIDITGWKAKTAVTMANMVRDCESLVEVKGIWTLKGPTIPGFKKDAFKGIFNNIPLTSAHHPILTSHRLLKEYSLHTKEIQG